MAAAPWFNLYFTAAQPPADWLRQEPVNATSIPTAWASNEGVPLASPRHASDSTKPAADSQAVAIVRQLARQRGGRPDALAQIIQLSAEFDDESAALVLEDLADAHAAAGHLDLAAEARQMLVEQYAQQPLAAEALLWLVRSYSSSEIAYSRRRQSQAVDNLRRQLSPAMQAALQEVTQQTDDQASAREAARTVDAGALYAYEVASRAATAQPALASDAAFAFQRSVAARRAGKLQAAQALLTPLKHRVAGDVWGDCARTEAWLQQSERGEALKPVAKCAFTAARPHLDGVLDEPCWQAEDAGQLCQTANVRWAYDNQFLYVAIRCSKVTGVAYPRNERPRHYDGDVHRYDRVRLAIDLDRDYATWFELYVDSRGWTADRCAGDATWNPQWYVAAAESSDGAAWMVEAAIPFNELTAEPVGASTAWACAATRLPPRSDAQPDAEPSPQDFGLLLFQ